MQEDRKMKPCPQCHATEDALFPMGVHPVYARQGQQPLDMQVEVWTCRQCGHMEVYQVA